ncbi:D-2-hydroxyacid dehydrogenase [Anatilimnocola sp. NA78]|uniref:D-2-hydroxyacid dehydrogenase n=1 Tax=Anatilimnocola sp. NA78 TaxID=3415683 RepID=UPI003CE5189E
MRIVLCYPVEDRHLQQIQAAAPGCEVCNAGQERIAHELLDADIFCGHAKVPVPWPAVVKQGRLQWIQSSAAGLDHCLTPKVIDSPIIVSSASGLFADQVAEQTFALMLGLLRSLPTFFRAQQKFDFTRRPTGDLHHKTVGIVGLGGNGTRIAEVLRPWKVRILATDVFADEKPDCVDELWPADQLPQLMQACDIVILCVPLNEQTHHLIGAKELAQMKKGSLLINVARGPVMDETALIAALQSGHLAGAGLDVTEVEPLPAESPLWTLPNVIITPHVGAQAKRRVDDSTDLICENLRRYLAGKSLLNKVDKRLGYPTPAARRGE